MGYGTFRVAARAIRRQKLHSVVAVTSLAVGLTCFILFFLSWRYERGYDRQHRDADRIIRLDRTFVFNGNPTTMDGQPAPMAGEVLRACPEAETATRWFPFAEAVLRHDGRSYPLDGVAAVDGEFFRVFTVPFRAGGPDTSLRDRSSIVLSERLARAVFGEVNPLGRMVRAGLSDSSLMERIHGRKGSSLWVDRDLVVTGVLKDPPSNATYRFEALVPFETAAGVFEELGIRSYLSDWRYAWFPTFVKVREDAPLPALARKVNAVRAANAPPAPPGRTPLAVTIVPTRLTDIHLADAALSRYLFLFGTIALAVLLLACINYVNLATARAFARAREVGVRKISGAGRGRLVRQFMVESLLTTGLALGAAAAAAVLVLPAFGALTGRRIVLGDIGAVSLVAGLAAIAMAVAGVSGALPAFHLAAIRPVELFARQRAARTSRSTPRKWLVFTQFLVSGVLLVATAAVWRQMAFVGRRDVGLNPEGVLVLRTDSPDLFGTTAMRSFKTELRRHPGIVAATTTSALPPSIRGDAAVRPESGETFTWKVLRAGPGFPEVFGARLVEGRFFSRDRPSDAGGAVVINETAARQLGPGPTVGKVVRRAQGMSSVPLTVIGVVRDFDARTAHYATDPLMMICPSGEDDFFLSLRLRPDDFAGTLAFVRTAWRGAIPDVPLDYFFLADEFKRAYAGEARLRVLTAAFAGVALFLGCIGLFGLVAYATVRRRREIGIRKALGSPAGRTAMSFFGEFARPVALANLAAWPAAFGLTQLWLREFVYRATMPFWIYAACGAAALGLSFAAVGILVVRAVSENPADVLRQE